MNTWIDVHQEWYINGLAKLIRCEVEKNSIEEKIDCIAACIISKYANWAKKKKTVRTIEQHYIAMAKDQYRKFCEYYLESWQKKDLNHLTEEQQKEFFRLSLDLDEEGAIAQDKKPQVLRSMTRHNLSFNIKQLLKENPQNIPEIAQLPKVERKASSFRWRM